MLYAAAFFFRERHQLRGVRDVSMSPSSTTHTTLPEERKGRKTYKARPTARAIATSRRGKKGASAHALLIKKPPKLQAEEESASLTTAAIPIMSSIFDPELVVDDAELDAAAAVGDAPTATELALAFEPPAVEFEFEESPTPALVAAGADPAEPPDAAGLAAAPAAPVEAARSDEPAAVLLKNNSAQWE